MMGFFNNASSQVRKRRGSDEQGADGNPDDTEVLFVPDLVLLCT